MNMLRAADLIVRCLIMKEIFEQIDKWLQEAKDNEAKHPYTGPEAFHRGEVAAYTKVGVLLQQRHLTSRRSRAAFNCACKRGGWFDLQNICINCGGIKPPPA